ncbi:peptide/nickel transport system ATP-binding protein [Desulfocicer vacuolatum DSM 3385]|uniref:Peptide/nickel transport system ATP-binding protein n=1 Tax=Desulfocicer vacuolatum DSM 3385 TaxID=1121400 RepID=A0A1W2D007_9BACT|nr:ABC transporter ATP-binding protein [Desulfocicer vacuolatum]SMC90422.1 peptide/nickel transport system ATP-binding protein [Desulfocicer vacuolatum DSM 3385]
MALLTVDNLTVGYDSATGMTRAVDDVSFTIESGTSLGFVGESGCGKTTIGMALMGLLPDNARILHGNIILDDQNLIKISQEDFREIRGRKIAMIFQAAMNALNPVVRVGDQVAEMITTHQTAVSPVEISVKIEELFDLVGIPGDRINDYPHQYSGGMKQRAIIAMALACNPRLIIADEPTTALDVVVQDQILKEIIKIQNLLDTGFVFISHDIAVVARVCEKICVMYDGKIVETGTREEVFQAPVHPYTRQLLGSYLTLDNCNNIKVPYINSRLGQKGWEHGCALAPLCDNPMDKCDRLCPGWRQLSPTHGVRCFKKSTI